MTGEKIKHRNQWCPICGGTQKSSIEEMHKLAAIKNGKCLSSEYINCNVHLTWQCSNLHI